MIRPSSQADIMADWDELLQAVQSNPDLQQFLEAEHQSLAQSLGKMQNLRGRQNELQGLRQEITQQATATVAEGRETAIKIRSVVRGKIGPKSERLVHFKVAPLRKRPRKAKETVKKPAGETPGTNPGWSAAPSGEGAV